VLHIENMNKTQNNERNNQNNKFHYLYKNNFLTILLLTSSRDASNGKFRYSNEFNLKHERSYCNLKYILLKWKMIMNPKATYQNIEWKRKRENNFTQTLSCFKGFSK
jgi:hypothetical protein